MLLEEQIPNMISTMPFIFFGPQGAAHESAQHKAKATRDKQRNMLVAPTAIYHGRCEGAY